MQNYSAVGGLRDATPSPPRHSDQSATLDVIKAQCIKIISAFQEQLHFMGTRRLLWTDLSLTGVFTSRCVLSKQKMSHYTNTDSDALGKVCFGTGHWLTGHAKRIEWAGEGLSSEAWKTRRVGGADSCLPVEIWSQRCQEFSELHVCLCHVMFGGACNPQRDTWQVHAYYLYQIKKIHFLYIKVCFKRILWINSNRMFRKNTYITNHKTQTSETFRSHKKNNIDRSSALNGFMGLLALKQGRVLRPSCSNVSCCEPSETNRQDTDTVTGLT